MRGVSPKLIRNCGDFHHVWRKVSGLDMINGVEHGRNKEMGSRVGDVKLLW